MILFLDTETSGLPQFGLPHDHPMQPGLVQLGMVLCEEDGRERASLELIVQQTLPIPRGASDVHGITNEIAKRCGVPLTMAVASYQQFAKLADTLVAHNLPFDERIMATAIHRANRSNGVHNSPPLKRVCTMELAEPVLRLPATDRMKAAGRGGQFKKPSLAECYRYFFHEEIQGAHSALADARACARIYFQVVLRGGMRRERTFGERLRGWFR